MTKELETVKEDMIRLIEDARILLSATGDVAEEKMLEARQRLAAAVDIGKKFGCRIGAKASERVKAADAVVRGHPYETIGIALGVGVLAGLLLSCRNRAQRTNETEST